MNLARPAVVDYRNNGKKPKPTFSDAEMKRRQDGIRIGERDITDVAEYLLAAAVADDGSRVASAG